ncbi:hypothetical protein D3C86_1371300 [compost metagenome]
MIRAIASIAGGLLVAYVAITAFNLPFPGRYEVHVRGDLIRLDTWSGRTWILDEKWERIEDGGTFTEFLKRP